MLINSGNNDMAVNKTTCPVFELFAFGISTVVFVAMFGFTLTLALIALAFSQILKCSG